MKTKKNRVIKSNKSNKSKSRKNYKRTFKKSDFYSGDGFLTTIWGPTQWHMLHTISFNYPVNPTPEQKKQYRNFVLSLQNVLPCGACRKNLKNNFKKLPLTMKDMESRNTFSRYIYNLHELVNKMLNKKSNLTYEEVRERYEHFRARCALPYSEIEKQLKKQLGEKSKEVGCVEPLYGEKSKCILHIVPQSTEGETLQIDEKCIKKKLSV